MSIWRISGKLTFTPPTEARGLTVLHIEELVTEHHLSEIISADPSWGHGVMQINSRPKEFLTDYELTSRLREFIGTDEIIELGLEGHLLIQFNEKRQDLAVTISAGKLTCKDIKPSHSNDAMRHSILSMYAIRKNRNDD